MSKLSCPRHPSDVNCSCLADISQGRRMLEQNEKREAEPQAIGEWIPEAGYVIVYRNFASSEAYSTVMADDGSEKKIFKPVAEQRFEEFKSRLATVVKVGDPDPRTGEMGTWREEDRVIIEPSVFDEIQLDQNGLSVWLGPFCGIKARMRYVGELAQEKAN